MFAGTRLTRLGDKADKTDRAKEEYGDRKLYPTAANSCRRSSKEAHRSNVEE